jgi:glycosyltransferase involved in cell wall biosynthesis
MNIGIIGTRGIPNHYGGFEQFAEYLATGLVERGHRVTVYNSHTHPYQQRTFRGVELVHCPDPEDRYGTVGQFIYDFNCIRDARRRNFDLILQLGYTSNSVWGWLLPRKPVIVTNMDGLEWKRSKYLPSVQKFLKHAERWAVQTSDFLVADSVGIQAHLAETYGRPSTYIPYGAQVFEAPEAMVLREFRVKPFDYDMLVARLEPENSIDVILQGVAEAKVERPFLVVGKHQTEYGQYLVEKYRYFQHIRFLGGIYNLNKLDNLRYWSNLYFHGHTVGGTNPSLLEAMASNALICAHDNIFNQAILGTDALYFTESEQVSEALRNVHKPRYASFLDHNRRKIQTTYHWPVIIDQYLDLFEEVLGQRVKRGVEQSDAYDSAA